MLKCKFEGSVQSPEEETVGLDVEADASLIEARKREAQERDAWARAQQQLEATVTRIADVTAAVAKDPARAADLDVELRARQVAEAVVPGHRYRLTAAEADVAAAKRRAQTTVIAEAGRRAVSLQVTAKKLHPILEALRDAERALDYAVMKAGGTCVPAVTWPPCRQDDDLENVPVSIQQMQVDARRTA